MSFEEFGRTFGYPECCLEMFTARAAIVLNIGPKFAPGTQFHHNGEATGYMMCADCAKRDREELIAEINARRDKSYPPFPTEFLP